MKEKNIGIILGLMIIALLGVVAMQYYFIHESQRLKSQLFDQNVQDALIAVSKKLEKKSAMALMQREERRRFKLFHTGANTSSNWSWAMRNNSDHTMKIAEKVSVFEELAKELINTPLKQRIDKDFLSITLKKELYNRGLPPPYEYQVNVTNTGALLFKGVSDANGYLGKKSAYTVSLFPNDIESGLLTVYFPNEKELLIRDAEIMLASSIGLLMVLVGCFIYTLYIIFQQKRISKMKTDFINNMTHEFKTPVTTIMIASEALKDDSIVHDRQSISKLASIIYDENARLGSHIERVLNIAKLERGNTKLERNTINVNELVLNVVERMTLQTQKVNAQVHLSLDANQATMVGDKLHVSNIIANLIDNASKYSQGKPEITIRTFNRGNKVVISIADKGTGMNQDQVSKIFDKFYRIPTGNLHNVKGFGIGLNYVNNVVRRLEGSIEVKTKEGEGSTFSIIFPTVDSG